MKRIILTIIFAFFCFSINVFSVNNAGNQSIEFDENSNEIYYTYEKTASKIVDVFELSAEIDDLECPYEDLDKNSAHYNDIMIAHKLGYFRVNSENIFNPGKIIRRSELASVITRGIKYKYGISVNVVSTDKAWYSEAVDTMCLLGIMSLDENGNGNWSEGATVNDLCDNALFEFLSKLENVWKFNSESGVLTFKKVDIGYDLSVTLPILFDVKKEIIKEVVIEDGFKCIGENAFKDCNNLRKVKLTDSIIEIKSSAFAGSALSNISIPEGVKGLGNSTFEGCESLSNVSIPEGVISLDSGLFRDCVSLSCIVIPESVTCLGNGVFEGCNKLKKITVPNGVVSLGYFVFRNCYNLEEINLPESIKKIGSNAFENTAFIRNKNNWEDGALYYLNYLIRVDESFSGEFDIKEGTALIASCAFENCKDIERIIIPKSITQIDEGAFERCTGLVHFEIPETITCIEPSAFYSCFNLKTVIIPNSVRSIGSNAFSNCENLASITLPNSLTKIGMWAFEGCTNLNRIFIPESVVEIDYWVFEASDNVVVYGFKNSFAQTYCNDSHVTFLAIDTFPKGELNYDGLIDVNDAVLLLQHSVFPDLYPIWTKDNCDYTKDGNTDIGDAILLLQHSMFPELYPID